MSDITVINDSEQSSLVTNGLAKNGELYLKAAGSTDAGAIVVYDSGVWRTFANEASAGLSNTYSVAFDGTDDVVTTATAYATTWSASAWIKPNFTSGTYGTIFSDAGPRRLYIYYDGTNYTVYLRQGSSPFNIITSSGNAIHDTWTHIAVTRDSSTSTAVLYINGSQVGTVTDGGDTANKAKPTNIGCINTSGLFPFNGKIDEFGWWDGTALSAPQIANISGGTNGIPGDLNTFNPDGWWRMGDGDDVGNGSGNPDGTVVGGNPQVYNMATDSSGNRITGNDGTLVNGPTFSTDVPS
jgi:hypothetical protein